MDLRIGIAESPQVIEVELANNVDRDELKAALEAAMKGDSSVVWVTDKKGREVAVPSAKISFVDLGSADSDRKIGFGA
jgi:uncharacterized protein (DUF2344 family)